MYADYGIVPKMPGFTLRHLPPENEQDFERLCLHLLREHWRCPDLQMYGRRGQRQNGVDILDLAGEDACRGAQCKNFNPLEAFTVEDLHSSIEAAKSFRPSLDRLEIMTTGRKSTETQLELRRINLEHRKKGLFRVRLKTWDEIELLLNKYPSVSEHIYGAGLWTAIHELEDQVRRAASQVEVLSGRPEAASSNIPDTQFNRVLVRWPGRLIERSEGEVKVMYQDFSILLLMIEELISFGAIELALDFVPGEFPTLLERVPAPLRNRLRFVGNPSLRNNVETMLSPVYEEFGIESLHGGFGLKFKSVGQPPGLGDLVGIVWSSLYDFLVGAKNCLQIDIDLAAFRAAVRELRCCSRNPGSRANLAVLEGILRSYQGRQVECIGLRSSASSEAVALFDHFAGIESYEISLELHTASVFQNIPKELCNRFLGFPAISRAHRNCEMSWFSALAAL